MNEATENKAGTDPKDRRRYDRLPSFCEVDYTIIRLREDLLGMGWNKGVTRNVSQGGLYIETDGLDYNTYKYLSDNNVYLDLRLHVPWVPHDIKAVAEVAWFLEPSPGHYEIGLEFRSIADSNLKLLLRHTKDSISFIFALKALAVAGFFGFIAWAAYQHFA